MCVEMTSYHYCGHCTSNKEVCGRSYVIESFKRQFSIRRLLGRSTSTTRATGSNCYPTKSEQKLFTICQLCLRNPELRRFIEGIPRNVPKHERFSMIAAWKAQQATGNSTQRDVAQAKLRDEPLERSHRDFNCSRGAKSRGCEARLPNEVWYKYGKRVHDLNVHSKRVKADVQKPLPSLPDTTPPLSFSQHVQAKSRSNQVPHQDPRQPQCQPRPAIQPSTVAEKTGNQELSEPKTPWQSKRIASPSKYLHPNGYQRDSTPPPRAWEAQEAAQAARKREPREMFLDKAEARPMRREIEELIDETEALWTPRGSERRSDDPLGVQRRRDGNNHLRY